MDPFHAGRQATEEIDAFQTERRLAAGFLSLSAFGLQGGFFISIDICI